MDIIISSDVGWDDITAISLLMKKKDINILGVVVTEFYAAYCRLINAPLRAVK